MGDKTKATPEEAREKGPRDRGCSAAAARSLRRRRHEDDPAGREARLRHLRQLNAVMPSEEVTSEKIEDILATLNEMGINVVETEEAEADEEEVREKPESEETESGELVGVTPNTPAKFEAKEPVERTETTREYREDRESQTRSREVKALRLD